MNKKTIQSLIFVTGLIVGGLGTGLYFRHMEKEIGLPKNKVTTLYNNLFERDFFRQGHSPFSQMEKMQKEMDKFFESSMKDFPRFTFEDWYGSKFGGTINDIKQDEDSKYVYYKINLQGIDRNSLKTDVSEGEVTISGSNSDIQAQEEEGQSTQKEIHQSFRRTFPVPAGVDSNKVEFETEDDELVIKFRKIR